MSGFAAGLTVDYDGTAQKAAGREKEDKMVEEQVQPWDDEVVQAEDATSESTDQAPDEVEMAGGALGGVVNI